MHFFVVLALIVRFPGPYRRGMARLCSIEEERIAPYPRISPLHSSGLGWGLECMAWFRQLSSQPIENSALQGDAVIRILGCLAPSTRHYHGASLELLPVSRKRMTSETELKRSMAKRLAVGGPAEILDPFRIIEVRQLSYV